MTRRRILNGRRVAVAFGSWSGRAGLTEHKGQKVVSFLAPQGEERPQAGGEILVSNKPERILAVAKSEEVAGMLLVTIAKGGG